MIKASIAAVVAFFVVRIVAYFFIGGFFGSIAGIAAAIIVFGIVNKESQTG